jgi:hypothetical protein
MRIGRLPALAGMKNPVYLVKVIAASSLTHIRTSRIAV